MAIPNLKRLRSKLPPHYASIIARNAVGIDNKTVQRVFSGEITDVDKVEKVVMHAQELAKRYARIKRLAKPKTTRKKA